MLSLNFFLILFFIVLVIYQIILANNVSIREGLDNYQPYDTNNPQNALILAQQNAGNIEALKDQIGDMSGLRAEVKQTSTKVASLENQMTQLAQAQKAYADQMTGGSAPNVTGT